MYSMVTFLYTNWKSVACCNGVTKLFFVYEVRKFSPESFLYPLKNSWARQDGITVAFASGINHLKN